MCGIGGVLRIYEPGEPAPPHIDSIPESWLDTLDDAIKHRGPDGQCRFRDRADRDDGTTVDVALVHRRLSIIDHEGGAQPMVHIRHKDGSGGFLSPTTDAHQRAPRASEGTPHAIDATHLPQGTDLVAVAFNGCIYNHRDLRNELEALGHHFETDHADTETVIHGWREWGHKMAERLDGMYAALVWDRQAGRLNWGRDLVGEKPIYFESTSGVFQFCTSTLPQLTVPSGPPYRPSRESAWWLRNGVHQWLPNSQFDIRPRRWESTPVDEHLDRTLPTMNRRRAPHHELVLPTRSGRPSRPNADFCDLIQTAVTSRLEADVPLGLFLSGGLDSALIAAIAKQHRTDIKAFTVRMPVGQFDESEAAAETAAHLGLDHTIIDCDPNTAGSTPADALVRLIEQLGLPFGDSSLLPTYWVCRAAREHITVALSGDGGDELFGGYRRHTINPTLNCYRHLLRLIPNRLLDQRRPGSRSTYLARLAVAARHGGYTELLSIFLTPDLRRLCPQIDGERPGNDEFHRIEDPLRHDFMNYLPDDLLRKTDTASMAVALEGRAPFLARDLVDAALRTPLDVLMPIVERKGLLKQVARNYLPDHIINRPKQGFAIPIGEWFRSDFGSLRQLLHDHLLTTDPFPGLADAGVEINSKFVHRMLREHDAAGERSLNPWHGRDHSQRLYMLLVLSIWSRWLDRTRREAARDNRSVT